ncbi:serine/arginine repetitive matrix protein 1, partial [Streptomyces sp. SID10116]|nr:serine/arginine repetitive matrix protein 1 [Streptomyces sp. SID10116]
MTSSASRRTVLGTAAAAPVLLSVPGTASATAPAASAAPATPSD